MPSRIFRTLRSILQMLPMIAGVLLIVSLIVNYLSPSNYAKIFTGDMVIDPVIGAAIGSVSAGNPITSYIIGGELMKAGIGMLPIVAFILCWVTVGVVQSPAEVLTLGKRFTVVRNIVSFVLSIIVSILVTNTLLLL